MPIQDPKIKTNIRKALKEIRPYLQKDGGDIRIVDYKDNILYVQFLGNCMHCKIKGMTLNTGVKYIFKNYIKQLKDVKEYKHG